MDDREGERVGVAGLVMTDRELMQMALDALIETVRLAGEYGTHLIRNDKDAGHAYETIEALRARLAQPKPEPQETIDKWIKANTEHREWYICPKCSYQAPRFKDEWQGLTDEDWIIGKRSADYIAGAEWAEAKLKEKNNG